MVLTFQLGTQAISGRPKICQAVVLCAIKKSTPFIGIVSAAGQSGPGKPLWRPLLS